MRKFDLTGKRFGRLFVIKRNGLLSNGKENLKAWECICVCGNRTIVRGRDLRTGNTKSCGCYQDEVMSKVHTKHGMSKTSVYKLWGGIIKRCSDNNNGKNKKFYRNIKVCCEWRKFENFYNWAKGKYEKGLDIDRKNTFLGYSPDNCRFVSRKTNTQNSKRSKWWYIGEKVFPSAYDAANHFGVVQSTIVSWCMGKKSGKYSYPPKVNCYAVKKYKENYANN